RSVQRPCAFMPVQNPRQAGNRNPAQTINFPDMDFSILESLLDEHLCKTFPAAQVEIRVAGEAVYSRAFGYVDPETRTRPTNEATKFDLASVSKLFTVTA